MRTYLVSMLALAVIAAGSVSLEAAESPALARARTLYNSGDYVGAIEDVQIHQVLEDGGGVAAQAKLDVDELAVGFAPGAGHWR